MVSRAAHGCLSCGMSTEPGGPAATYRERSARFAAERDRLDVQSRRLSTVRVVTFALLVAAGLLVERSPAVPTVSLAAALLVVFIVLIGKHRRVRVRLRWQQDLLALNEQGLHRLARTWDRLPVRRAPADAAGHAYAADLDLYGRASLSQILGPVGSAAGASTLDGWLLHRADAATIRARQAAVLELAARHDLREALAVHARRSAAVRVSDVDRFLLWAESPDRLGRAPGMRLLTWTLPLATWLLIVLHATGTVSGAFWLLTATATLLVYFTAGARARRTFERAFGREAMFAHYPRMLALITQSQFDAPLLVALRDRLVQHRVPADRHLAELRRLMHLADLRTSSMHLPIFLVTMWDLHVLRSLERWQDAAGSHARDWLAALGEMEALSSIATLAHDEPDWCFPELLPHGSGVVEATALGHPLIPAADRVCNDVTLGPPGTFLLVTGSNMSGKSTLLRAIGTNAVLAQVGAPCCARALRLPPLEVHTSIRVQDSLARGVSYFMAELERLKQIVDAAHAVRDDGTATQLFLLDEILHGTNSAERRVAARRVIMHLIDAGAIGAATTHDLELAVEPGIAEATVLVHFQEQFEAEQLTFDYRLRDGLATSTNALILMRLVGLPA
jgi:hypothetical protein